MIVILKISLRKFTGKNNLSIPVRMLFSKQQMRTSTLTMAMRSIWQNGFWKITIAMLPKMTNGLRSWRTTRKKNIVSSTSPSDLIQGSHTRTLILSSRLSTNRLQSGSSGRNSRTVTKTCIMRLSVILRKNGKNRSSKSFIRTGRRKS